MGGLASGAIGHLAGAGPNGSLPPGGVGDTIVEGVGALAEGVAIGLPLGALESELNAEDDCDLSGDRNDAVNDAIDEIDGNG